ncbi:unnamed protein product [Mytilus coruscus]|uniref:Uncharacterized protein n=1 Tax=Mytilus coruscus TaxID=42192 RepID=A0A6J8DC38_MYTCO|nr:unnamed protein product [Mytilus coruscus]
MGGIINKLLRELQNLQRIIICEEKYSFTPDVFKAATRQKRQTKDPVTIAHLKEKDEIISRGKFSKKAAITTGLGKKAVSNYLGKHMTELDIQADIIIDVDSEAVYGQCQCEDLDKCTCPLFTTPVRAVFTQGNGFSTFGKFDYDQAAKGTWYCKFLLQFKEINESGVKRFKCTIDVDQYVKLYLKLYYPKNVEQEKLTFEEVRQLTIKIPGKSDFRHPQTWMPPESSLRQLAKLVQCQIDYLLTVFNPGASLPNFMASGCLKVRQDGSTIYNQGPNCHIDNRDNLITVSEETLANKLKAHTIPLNRKSGKRQLDDTPQKGKSSKRQPKMSTPRKIQARRKLPD